MTWWQRLLAALRVRPTPPPPPPPPWRPPPGDGEVPDAADPTGFVPLLNAERARHGLPPVEADADLLAWAVRNNRAQADRDRGRGVDRAGMAPQLGLHVDAARGRTARELGHFVFPPVYLHQNSAWNYPDARSVLAGWMGSPGHREGLLDSAITRAGCAHDGAYWTFNAGSSV